MKPIIEVRVAGDEADELAQGGPVVGPRLSRFLEDELNRFDAWMNSNLQGGLTRMERAAVKTYLYQKIVGRIDDLERKSVDVLELVKSG